MLKNRKKWTAWSVALLCMLAMMVTICRAQTNAIVITFDANGGEVAITEQEVGAENKPEHLPTPTQTGYRFEGLYTAREGGEEITTDTVFDQSTIIYARWSPCEHSFLSPCDTTCEVCGDVREAEPHAFDSICDSECNRCGEIRMATHIYQNDCDATCEVCGHKREAAPHQYAHDCDAICNICEAQRIIHHIYDHECDPVCNNTECGQIREIAHCFSAECDAVCNVCQAKRASLAPHTYSNENSEVCRDCGEAKAGDHFPSENPDNTPSNPQTTTPPSLPTQTPSASKSTLLLPVVGAGVAAVLGGFSLWCFVIKKKTFADFLAIFKK